MNNKFMLRIVLFALVVGGIGIFITRGMASWNHQSSNAAAISDIGQMELALELYFNEHQQYPPIGSCQSVLGGFEKVLSGKYLPEDFFSRYRKLSAPMSFYEQIFAPRPVYNYAVGVSNDQRQYVLSANVFRIDTVVLTTDIDGQVFGCNCDDPNYCVGR